MGSRTGTGLPRDRPNGATRASGGVVGFTGKASLRTRAAGATSAMVCLSGSEAGPSSRTRGRQPAAHTRSCRRRAGPVSRRLRRLVGRNRKPFPVRVPGVPSRTPSGRAYPSRGRAVGGLRRGGSECEAGDCATLHPSLLRRVMRFGGPVVNLECFPHAYACGNPAVSRPLLLRHR